MPIESWKAALRLAKMWLECILFYQQCELELDEVFVEAVQDITSAQRGDLSTTDAARLGMENVAKIYRLVGWREACGVLDTFKIREVWGMPSESQARPTVARTRPKLTLPRLDLPRLDFPVVTAPGGRRASLRFGPR